MKKYQFLAIMCVLVGILLITTNLIDIVLDKDSAVSPFGAVGLILGILGVVISVVGAFRDKNY